MRRGRVKRKALKSSGTRPWANVSAPPQDNVASEADVSEKEEKKEKECTTPKIR